jgi:hypothetical protein
MKLPTLLHPFRVALCGATLLGTLSACVGSMEPAGAGVVWVQSAPPRERYEPRPEAPGPDYIWITGFWVWGGSSYDWTPGHWEHRPSPRARYERGRWNRGRGGWYWVDGRWRDDDREHGRGHGRGHDKDRD